MVIVMENHAEIPCASCTSWKRKERKFSCNPDGCAVLTAWLFANAPQLCRDRVQLQVQLPEVAVKYVV